MTKIQNGLKEVAEAKKSGKKLQTLKDFLGGIKVLKQLSQVFSSSN